MKVANKVVVVTGGGSGIGRQLCLNLLAQGAHVAAADINVAGMAETAQLASEWAKNFSSHAIDISNREKVHALPQKVLEVHGRVDGIINNAGIIQPFIKVNELSYDHIERIVNINFYGTLYMVKAFLPHLLKRPEAHVVNISSMGGFIPFPGQTFYGASKAAVKLLTEGLHAELHGTQVKVTVVFPGAINTNIKANSGVPTSAADEEMSNSSMVLSPDKAAKIIIRGMEKDQYRVLVGKDARFLDLFYRLSPARASRFIVSKMEKLLS